MKLRQKIRAILAFAVLAIISVACAACSNAATSSKEFKFVKDLPTEVLYGSELYFRDYLPREYGQDYKLYASYFDVQEQKNVEEEMSDSLAFKFEHVSDYSFKIVRNGKDVINCEIKSMPQAPRVVEGVVWQQTARPTNTQTFDRILAIVFGGIPLENNDNATADPNYTIKATNAQFKSVEIEGVDVESIDISSNKITFDKIGYYNITYTATNRAGSDSGVVTVRTVNTKNHIDTLTGYLLENGEGLDDNQLVFDMDLMTAPADGESVRVRYGEGKGENSAIYNAVYDAYTGKYTIDNFAHEMTKEDVNRIYLEDAEGELYSTNVTLPNIITQSTITKAGTSSPLCNATEGYYLLGSDLNLANYPCTPSTTFMGVLDGNGYTISGITGEKYIDNYGAERVRGAALFSVLDDAIVKNLVLEDVHATTGMLTNRVEGSCEFKNIIAKMKSYVGARTSLLGYHAEDSETSYVKNVIIETPIWTVGSSGTYVGMLTTHAGSKVVLENLYLVGGHGLIHSTAGNSASFVPKHYTDREESESGMAEEGIDYFVGKSAEVVFDGYNSGNLSQMVFDMAGKIKMVVGLDNSNIDELQTAKGGYFYLKEDIDMAGKTWNPTQSYSSANDTRFVGTLNGNGHKIINFTSPAGYKGLVGHTGTGATIKNVYIHMITNTSKGGLTGQIRGVTTIENVVVEVDKMVAGLSGVISDVVQGDPGNRNTKDTLIVKDSYILIKSTTGSPNGDGFIAGGEADSHNVVVSNVKVADATGIYTNPYTGVTNKLGVTLGTDGEPAVNGEDYVAFIGDYLDVNADEIEDETYRELTKKAIEAVKKTVVKITKDGREGTKKFDVLMSEGSGYYLLEDDIDLTGITWTAGATFTGTLNGQGHKVSNFSGNSLFKSFAGTVKNVNFINASHTGNGFLAGAVSASVTIQNTSFELSNTSGARKALLGYQTGGVATLKDVNIYMPTSPNSWGYAFVTTHAISGITFDNVYMFGGTGNFHSNGGNHSTLTLENAKMTGVENEDYFIYASANPLLEDAVNGKLSASLTKFFKDMGFIVAINEQNFGDLRSATFGYYYLEEDIDMAEAGFPADANGIGTWTTSGTFTGVLNGNGKTISNFALNHNQYGLLPSLGAGANVKNLIIKGKVCGNNNGTITATISGTGVVIENVLIDLERFSAYGGGVIARNLTITNGLTMRNIMVVVRDSVINTSNGLLFGNYGADRTCAVENFYLFDLATAENKVTQLHNGRVTINGTVNQYTKASDLDKNTLPTQFLKDAYDVAFAG